MKTQYERLMSGEITAEGITAEIKAASERKAQDAANTFKRLPGHVLVEEFLVPYFPAQLSDLAMRANIPAHRLKKLIRGQDRIDADMANKLSAFYGKPAEYFLGIQERFERGEAL